LQTDDDDDDNKNNYDFTTPCAEGLGWLHAARRTCRFI